MMIEPPIDKLIEKVSVGKDEEGGCKYTLCCLVSKRARYLQEQMPAALDEAREKAISYAAEEVYNGKIKPTLG